jgi:hypothetical protein
MVCVNTNGVIQIVRSSYLDTAGPTTPCKSWVQTGVFKYNGFDVGRSDLRFSDDYAVTSLVSDIRTDGDVEEPVADHFPMQDSHASTRTFVYHIRDAGDPTSGLNTSDVLGVGPTLYYTVTHANGTVDGEHAVGLSPDRTRSECARARTTCAWTATVGNLDRGSSVAYHVRVRDRSTGRHGVQELVTEPHAFHRVAPTKVFTVEWHGMTSGFNSAYRCTTQVRFYDVSNEIEFHYDPDCSRYYDYESVGYQDATRTRGATVRGRGPGYVGSGHAHTTNYRIYTDGPAVHGWEPFDMGPSMRALPEYTVAGHLDGTADGKPTTYYCAAHFNAYQDDCGANIDFPDGFAFEYFGTTFDGDDSNARVSISKHGALRFRNDNVTALEAFLNSNWGTTMPPLASGDSGTRPNLVAPYWGYYSSYYSFEGSGVRYAVEDYVDCDHAGVLCAQREPTVKSAAKRCGEAIATCDSLVTRNAETGACELIPDHRWALTEAVDATIAADTGFGDYVSDLVLVGGNATFLGSEVGGGVVLPNDADQNSYLDFVGGGFAFAAVDGFTFTAFVRFDSFQMSGMILYLNDGSSNVIALYTYGATRRARFWIKNDGTNKFLNTPTYRSNDTSPAFFPPAGAWAHVAAVVSPDGVTKLYRDGATQGNWTKDDGVAPNPSTVPYTRAALGRYESSNNNGLYYFDGALRDVRLYARALGGDEIAAIAGSWTPPPDT